MKSASPLRYPGGKWKWTGFFERLLSLNNLVGSAYAEPYAGGASLALSLLFRGAVAEVHLNDLDRSLYAFWRSVLKYNRDFVRRVSSVKLTIEEWERQKETHRHRNTADLFDLGFATFYLNRTNRSGVLNGGVIGGKKQRGEWKIDARFNKPDLIFRLRRVGQYADRIKATCLDAEDFIRQVVTKLPRQTVVYLDPPYFVKGRDLYMNAYHADDHLGVRTVIDTSIRRPWIVSYDDVPEVRRLYTGCPSRRMAVRYSARAPKVGDEVLFFSEGLAIPRKW